ncbi:MULTISPECIES: ATP-grasp domain-containing protein [Calothrix]|uniref:RimK domain-containing protein ATP-grasp n=2 Tax=Calothrix TaxID=1186 RepID=A0ABR8AHM6_9CYAN|nr:MULTISPECIES: RimK domain-containing protein ATP-grasp [Calothrix]MBD2198745.1 RimK domain-containing protein ATP-grasp [Calothrix parietina FACHB-288]MBD2228607.1 RimK domain-containing protein ATP-grasp [Calothrix anomala FACHB-343]
MLILLWGISEESPLAAVYSELNHLGVPTVILDQRDILDTEIELCVGDLQRPIQGQIRTWYQKIDLSEITAAYLRPYDSRRLPQITASGANSPAWQHAIAVDDTLMGWSEITPAFVINRPSFMAANGSKPYQLQQIRSLGFKVPDTLVTTDPEAVRAFWQLHGNVIYKSISGIRSKVSRLGVEHLERLDDVAWCPTQFQQYIPGRDYRVHVVGTEVFASEIVSQADDYRYAAEDDESTEIRACYLPQEVEQQCRILAKAINLPLCGIDLRRTPTGEWYCFEVNPSPGFTYYQQFTGQPISQAIANLLIGNNRIR